MKLTLGQAAKRAGVSKTAVSNAIKKGRLSAVRSESGPYEIDPAELFRVYPPKPVNETETLTALDPVNLAEVGVNERVLTAQLTGAKTLLEEKNTQIERLIQEKERLEDRLTESAEQQKRLTLMLTDQSQDKKGQKEQKEAQEKRLETLEKTNEELKKQNRRVFYELKAQQELSLWEKIFGKKDKGRPSRKSGQGVS